MALDAKTNNVCVDARGPSKEFPKDNVRNDLFTTLAGLSLDHLMTWLGMSFITWPFRHLLG